MHLRKLLRDSTDELHRAQESILSFKAIDQELTTMRKQNEYIKSQFDIQNSKNGKLFDKMHAHL